MATRVNDRRLAAWQMLLQQQTKKRPPEDGLKR
jgi:hypothetical protein